MTNHTTQRLAAEARAAIARSGLHKTDVADAIGIDPSTLRRKLDGKRSFSAEELVGLARATGAKPSQLLDAVLSTDGKAA